MRVNNSANLLMRGFAYSKRCQETWVVRRTKGGGLRMPLQVSKLQSALGQALALLLLLQECW